MMTVFDFRTARALSGGVFLGLLLTACASSKSAWDMSESQRIRAANGGNMEAISLLQTVNYYDKDRNQHYRSKEEQLKWVRKGAELGDGASQYRLAYLSLYANENSLPVKRDPAEALRLAQSAADTMKRTGQPGGASNDKWVGGAKTLAERASIIIKQQPLADKGDANAMYALSEAYAPLNLFGLGTLDSKADEAVWLKKAAEAGQPQALTAMANRATTPQEKLAWQQKAAATGTADAMLQLANNQRASGDEKAALEWYRKAAAKGSEPARKAVLQLTDANVLRLQSAAASGDAEAMYELGEYFRAGNWAGKDNSIAQQWYLKAAAKNHVNASYQAAVGSSAPAEKDRLMRAAANGGNAEAAKWVAGEERRLAAERQQRQAQQEAQRRQAEAERQQKIADQQAFVARIDREGTIDSYEAEVYCRFGGRRCDEMRRAARVALERNNAAAEAANMRRIQNLYSDGKSADQRNQEYLDRSKCLQNNTQAIQNNTYGKTDWSYKDCK
ncbi:MAG: hypothetical protein REI12_01820 [Pedobacter sp.]|nr:hypothetical protein [Pedobacter sp.]